MSDIYVYIIYIICLYYILYMKSTLSNIRNRFFKKEDSILHIENSRIEIINRVKYVFNWFSYINTYKYL